MKKTAIYFDLDGTLTDPKPGIIKCYQYALQKLGLTVPDMDDLVWVIGPPLWDSFAQMVPKDMIPEAVSLYRERFFVVGYKENQVYEGIPDLLRELQAAGYALFTASSKPHISVEKILIHFGLRDYFTHCYGSEMDGARSDKAELLAYALAHSSVKPKEALMVGDRKFDIIGARHHDITSIGVTYGYGGAAELKAAKAHHIVETVPALAAKVKHLMVQDQKE